MTANGHFDAEDQGALARAVAHLVGALTGLLAFGAAWIGGALAGVGQTTLLVRAALIGLAAAALGRVVGWLVGRSLARTVAGGRRSGDVSRHEAVS